MWADLLVVEVAPGVPATPAAIRCSQCCCLHMDHGCEPITSKYALCMCMNHDGGGMACVHANNMNNVSHLHAIEAP